MTLEEREDGWWITGVPEGVDEMGVYSTKAEANDDMQGVKRFLKACDGGVDREFVLGVKA